MKLHSMKCIDSPNQFICDGPTTLILDIEIDAKDGKFPSPENADGKIICVTVDISFNEGSVCYGLKEISQELRDIIAKGRGRYVTCKDERDLITKVLTSIYSANPTHARGEDTIPALKFLASRAEHLGIKIKVPDYDSMFRHYDYVGIIGEPPAHKEQEHIDDMYLKLSEIGRQYEIVNRNPLTIRRKD